MNEKNRGLLYVLLGAIAFSLGGIFVKLIPWNPIAINAGRCIFSSLIIYSYIRLSKHRLIVNRTVVLGGLSVAAMLLCYVASIKYTSAANAIVLEYTAPIFIVIFEALIFRKKPDRLDLIVCLVVFIGICIVVSEGLGKGGLFGDMVALASGVFYAFTIMLNDFEGGDSLSSVLFGHVLTAIIGFPFIFQQDLSLNNMFLVVALGVFQAGAGYTLLAVGLKKSEPLAASLVASIEPVLNPILVAVFYKEYVGVRTLLGAFIVIVSIAVYNILSLKRNKEST